MKLNHSLFIFLLIPIVGNSQQITVVAQLPNTVKETSGLIYLNQKIITHNDSGDEAILYELDSITGSVTRKVVVSDAINIDWEDLCFDETYIYIADIGNNNGTRTNLKVYRIPILDYFTTVNDTVIAKTIHFNYSDQTDFTPSPFTTNFDAEAIVSWNDSLYIFTKNWGNFRSNVYILPKTLGFHQINKVDSINSLGLVTGATSNLLSNTIMLLGYTFSEPFILEISNITDNEFSDALLNRYPLQIPNDFSYQTEGILYINQSQYYLTSEEGPSGDPGLFRLDLDLPLNVSNIEQTSCVVYPNPASDILNIEFDDLSTVKFYNTQGCLQKTSSKPQISISDLNQGLYTVIIKNSKGDITISRITVIK